jgi:hypothetical protein
MASIWSSARAGICGYAKSHFMKLRWEAFNVKNLTRFDFPSLTSGVDRGPAFGNFSGLLTQPRVMQFALRYEILVERPNATPKGWERNPPFAF